MIDPRCECAGLRTVSRPGACAGDGNVMWSGGFPGAGYDSVVLTVQGGFLQGRFGGAERVAYWIRADADGVGRMVQLVDGLPDVSCPGGIAPDQRHGAPVAAAQRADPPSGVVSAFGDTAESFSELGYGVTSAICSVRDQSGDFPYVSRVFSHEVGHNLGAQHDPMNARSDAKDFVIKPRGLRA